MPPLYQLSIRDDGKPEIAILQATVSVQVCVERHKRSLVNTYFEDTKTQQQFDILNLSEDVSVNIGLYKGEAWYHWVWMWESREEADLAWSKVPPGQVKMVKQLAQKIDDFILDASQNTKSRKSKATLDITPDLRNIGWEATILAHAQDEIAREYNMSTKVRKSERVDQLKKMWREFWKK